MHIILKFFYLILFWSLDVLLYFRLVKEIVNIKKWLVIVAAIWLIVGLLSLPSFHLYQLMPLKVFIVLSAMIIQLLILYYIGSFAIQKFEGLTFPEEVKQIAITWLGWVFKGLIFVLIPIMQLVWILSWNNYS